MTNILSLSTELLVLVYISSPTIQTAALLSGTSQRLRAVWLEHGNHIIAHILEPQIPAYTDAVELAILEETWTDNSHPGDPVPTRRCLRRLLQNSDLALSAVTAWETYETRTCVIPKQASYYLARKLLLARHRPESRALLLPTLFKILVTSPTDTLHNHVDFIGFLTSSSASYKEQLRHGIPKPKAEWDESDFFEDEAGGPVNWAHWDWVLGVLDTAMFDRTCGNDNLEGLMFDIPELRSVEHIEDYKWVYGLR